MLTLLVGLGACESSAGDETTQNDEAMAQGETQVGPAVSDSNDTLNNAVLGTNNSAEGEVEDSGPTGSEPIPWNLDSSHDVRVRLDSSWNGRETTTDFNTETVVDVVGRADQMTRLSLSAGAYDELFDVGPDQVRVRVADEWMTFVHVTDFEHPPTEPPGTDPAAWTCTRAANPANAGNRTCVGATLTCTRVGAGMVRQLEHRGTFCEDDGWQTLVRHATLEGGGERTVRLDVVGPE